ncbi:hypothetical protein [Endothiovibrio diazotrophicus]
MTEIDASAIKQREICFAALHPDPNQAHTALLLLDGIEGMESVRLIGERCIGVRYDLRHLSLQVIEEMLSELGFHLETNLLTKLKRALYYYTEETECANRGCQMPQPAATREIFINRYQHLPHGCRDPRPEYWRRYL